MARTLVSRSQLLTSTLCHSDEWISEDKQDQIFCCSTADEAPFPYSIATELEQRLIPRVLELVRSPDGHQICQASPNSAEF